MIHIGRYGLLRKAFLKTHRKITYNKLLIDGTLTEYLAAIDSQAFDMLDNLVRQMAVNEGITEQLKATDQMAWVGAMNNIKSCAEEIIFHEIIHA